MAKYCTDRNFIITQEGWKPAATASDEKSKNKIGRYDKKNKLDA